MSLLDILWSRELSLNMKNGHPSMFAHLCVIAARVGHVDGECSICTVVLNNYELLVYCIIRDAFSSTVYL